MTYNLLDESWIPVLYRNGRRERLGILKALEEAASIRQIAASNPMDRVAILRFLLALLYWCRGNPATEEPGENNLFTKECFEKLEGHRECFNLLGEGKRFYQYSDATRRRTVTDLLHEIPTGNNFWHFRHSTDNVNGLCPSCCAIGLLRLPLFSVSGLPNLKAGINGTPPIYVIPLGRSLSETLQFNWRPCNELGEPTWIKSDHAPAVEREVPTLVGLTLLSRRVYLDIPSKPPDCCTGCGNKESVLIRTCAFETAGDQKNDYWNDPHVVYSEDTPRKASVARDLTSTGRFKMDRPWPDLFSRIIETRVFSSCYANQTFLLVGFTSDKAKYVDVWERTINLSHGLSSNPIEQWRKESDKLEKRIGRAKLEGRSSISSVRPHIEDHVSSNVNEFLINGTSAWEQAAKKYRPMMQFIARSLYPGISLASVRMRRDVANMRPDMEPKIEKKTKATTN